MRLKHTYNPHYLTKMDLKDCSEIFRYIRDFSDGYTDSNKRNAIKKVIDKWMLKNGRISKVALKEFLDEVIEVSDWGVGIEQLIPQYNLALECLKLSQGFNFRIFPVQFKYFDYDGCYKNGNFYVPHFYRHPFINASKEIIKHYPARYCLGWEHIDDNMYLSTALTPSDENWIIKILEMLPFEKKNIHIGFFFDDNNEHDPKFSKFQHLVERLAKMGYETYGNNIRTFSLTEFSWDDSYLSTITVLVDFISYENTGKFTTEKFLTFEGEFTETYMPGRLIYLSIFQEDRKEQIKRDHLSNQLLASLYSEWLSIPNYPFFLFPIDIYYPKGFELATDVDKSVQKYIWDFKNGGFGSGLQNNTLTTLEECVEQVKTTLICTFGADECKNLMLLCVPPSSEERYITRYKRFSMLLNSKLSIKNGFDYITYHSEAVPKHIGGTGSPEVYISSEIKGKNVIIFDDVYTTGNTINCFSKRLSDLGANVIGAIVLAITQHDKEFENEICYGWHGLYDYYEWNIW